MCPPSSAGIGSRFSTPKFTEISAAMMSRVETPMPAAFEVMSVIWMMPPISFSGTTPTISFSSPVNMSFEAFTVSTSANLSELKEQIKRDINEARQCVGVCDLFFGETMRYFDGYGAGI